MKVKKRVQKLIEENFYPKESYEDDELEIDNLCKVSDILGDEVEEFPINFERGKFHSKEFPGDAIINHDIPKRFSSSEKNFFDSPSESDSDFGSNINEKSQKKSKRSMNFDGGSIEDFKEREYEKESEEEYENSSDEIEENDTADESVSDESEISSNRATKFQLQRKRKYKEKDEEYENSNDSKDESINAEIRTTDIDDESISDESEISPDVPSELEKGKAVRSQLQLWEVLLESRITIQKCLTESNKLPKPENFDTLWSQCSQENKNVITDCRETLWDLLEKLLHVQKRFRKQCFGFTNIADTESKEEMETECDKETFKVKRRKLMEYENILEKEHKQYASFRDSVIQKWNDRTKIACGKLAKSNFSAFDQPVLKQIELIMNDKLRLIQRTHVKRSEYKIIGENENANLNSEVENEIFDDDDFYHKLLRDYIERKTADISDPTQLSKKWIKLQSLRNKMKRKIDTRCTKGRKIKFDVHNKLVNFMAPNTLSRWEDNAINELYSSVFGKGINS